MKYIWMIAFSLFFPAIYSSQDIPGWYDPQKYFFLFENVDWSDFKVNINDQFATVSIPYTDLKVIYKNDTNIGQRLKSISDLEGLEDHEKKEFLTQYIHNIFTLVGSELGPIEATQEAKPLASQIYCATKACALIETCLRYKAICDAQDSSVETGVAKAVQEQIDKSLAAIAPSKKFYIGALMATSGLAGLCGALVGVGLWHSFYKDDAQEAID